MLRLPWFLQPADGERFQLALGTVPDTELTDASIILAQMHYRFGARVAPQIRAIVGERQRRIRALREMYDAG